jgi:NAD-dependent DNA ligase
LRQRIEEEIEAVSDIGSKIAESIVSYFDDEDNIALIESLKNAGLQITDDEVGILSEELGMSLERLAVAPEVAAPRPFLNAYTAQRRFRLK